MAEALRVRPGTIAGNAAEAKDRKPNILKRALKAIQKGQEEKAKQIITETRIRFPWTKEELVFGKRA